MLRYRILFAAAAIALLVALPASAGKKSITLDIGDDDDGLRINLSGSWLAEAILDGLTDSIDCEDDQDRESRKMLLHLRKNGEGSSYTMREDDEVTKAYRRNGKLEIRKFEPGEEPTLVVLPWAMGECMLGNSKPLRKLGDDFEMRIEKDGEVSLKID